MAKPKQKDLPGMERRRLEDLEGAAEKYRIIPLTQASAVADD